MKTIKRVSSSTTDNSSLTLQLSVFLALLMLQTPVLALQFESIAIRNMTSYKKFGGTSQSAIVIKSRENRAGYLDRFEFSSGELTDGETRSVFISFGPAWRFKPSAIQLFCLTLFLQQNFSVFN